MGNEDLLKTLEEEYPNTIDGIENMNDLIKVKAQQELVAHIRLLLTPAPKRKG